MVVGATVFGAVVAWLYAAYHWIAVMVGLWRDNAAIGRIRRFFLLANAWFAPAATAAAQRHRRAAMRGTFAFLGFVAIGIGCSMLAVGLT
jgi:hypothetical protein